MTREEAVFYIVELQKTYAYMDKKVAEAVDMAIEALSESKTGAKIVPKEELDMYIAGYRDGHDDATKTAKWIKGDDYICDYCGCHMAVGGGAYNYCPSCGKWMLEKDGEA